jgi:hypothetical protein
MEQTPTCGGIILGSLHREQGQSFAKSGKLPQAGIFANSRRLADDASDLNSLEE